MSSPAAYLSKLFLFIAMIMACQVFSQGHRAAGTHAAISDIEIYEHNYLNTPLWVKGIANNSGTDTISSFTINYSVNGAAPITAPVSGLVWLTAQPYTYTHPVSFLPVLAGTCTISVWFSSINGSAVSSDTSSVTIFCYPASAGLHKNVLIEEFTGAWCGYCPGGALAIRDITEADAYAVPVAIHDNNGGGALQDAMQITGGDVINATYNIVGMPSAMIDRLYLFDNQAVALGIGLYNTNPGTNIQDMATAFRYHQATPVNVSLSDKTYDSITGSLSVTVNATFLDSLSQGEYRLNLYVVEDSVITPGAGYDQDNYYSAAGNDADPGNSPLNAFPPVIVNNGQPGNWSQNHVLRAMSGGPFGTAGIIPSDPAAGATYSDTYTVVIDSVWRAHFLSLIGIVQEYNANNINLRTILNVAEVPLTGWLGTGIPAIPEWGKLSVYPNPATTMATVDISLNEDAMVSISVINMLGQIVSVPSADLLNAGEHTVKVPVSGLDAGLYMLRVSCNGQNSILPLTVSRY